MNSDIVYNMVEKLRSTRSINAKKETLKKYSKYMAPFLFYAYNPYYRYKIRKLHPPTKGTRYINKSDFDILQAIQSNKLSGMKAKRAITKIGSELTYKSNCLFNMMVLKDFKCGVNTTLINECIPNLIPVYNVQLAEEYNESKIKFPCWVSPKIDGNRGTADKRLLLSRGGHPYIGLDHIIKDIRRNGIMGRIDGELVIPGVDHNTSDGLIRNKKETPEAIFLAFDLPDLAMPFPKRYLALRSVLLKTRFSRALEHILVYSIKEIDDLYDRYRSQKLEGIVIKQYDYTWEGKRNYSWMKKVPENYIDARVVGVYYGKENTKYEKMIGGILLNYRGKEVKVGSGISDKQRYLWAAEPGLIVGRVVECLYKEKSKSGIWRDPRFVRVRGDKE